MSSYSNLIKDISSGQIDSLVLFPTRREVKATYKDGTTSIIPIFPNDQTILRKAQESDTPLTVNYLKFETASASIFANFGFLFILIFGMLFFIRKSVDLANKSFNFFNKQNKLQDIDKLTTTFEDIAGLNEAVEEIKEIVTFLTQPELFEKLGARIPKGFLLAGPPGTGKTLLSRAIAGEAGVPFYSLSASEFVELFIGVGASRVRSIFNEAKKNSPSIIFIDEIDAIGRQRGAGVGGGNDEREQTLNQLLTEIDGFSDNSGVVVIAATNRADILDSALTRPGRFDRTIDVTLPDRKGRLDILSIHARHKPLADEVSLNEWAIRTPGFSGADLNNLLNEAAIITARNNKKLIGNAEIDHSLDRLTLGLTRPGISISSKNRVIAYHQIGKALVSLNLPNIEKIDKITILPTSNKIEGNTRFVSNEEDLDSGLITKSYLSSRLIRALGGRAAEILIFGINEITQISSNDLTEATYIAREMITRYGFSDLGLITSDLNESSVFLGRSLLSKNKSRAEKTYREIDVKVISLLKNALQEAINILNPLTFKIDKIADILIDEETLTLNRFIEILESKNN